MDRFCIGRGGQKLVLTLLLLTLLPGCGAMATMMWIFSATDQKAEFTGLEKKRVAVVCRSVATMQYKNSGAAIDLSKEVGIRLQKNVKKIEVIDPKKVGEWTDENNLENFTDIGKALNADMVVALDLEEFSLLEGQTLYRGKAVVHMTVYDMHSGGKEVFERPLPQILYPPNTPMPAADMLEPEFYRQFIGVLAEQISRHFYDHDSTLDVAADSEVYNHH